VIRREKVSASSGILQSAQISQIQGYLQSLTRLDITPFFPLAFLLLPLEVIRYSGIGCLVFVAQCGCVADSRRSRVEGGPG
jgi:hypothetical protein